MQNPGFGNPNPTGARRRESRYQYRNHSDKKQRAASVHSNKNRTIVESRRCTSFESLRKNQISSPSGSVSSIISENYNEFLERVNCPFCLKVQTDKISLIKHLGETCQTKTVEKMPFAPFQILSRNTIKCNLCKYVVLNSVEDYFFHAAKRHHKRLKGNEFIFCSSCKMMIPNNGTELQCHLTHRIHNARRWSLMDYYTFSKEICCIYCFYEGSKKFKCLGCPPPDNLFNTTFGIIHHFKTDKHLKHFKKSYLIASVYCCFCDVEVPVVDTAFHFNLKTHLKKASEITEEGRFELCLYCGFACSSLKELSTHMKSNCEKINEIMMVDWKKRPNSNEDKINKERSILIPGDVDVIEFTKTLKKVFEIKCVDKYGDDKLVIEFQNEAAVKLISLIRGFIKVEDEKVDVQFFTEVEREKNSVNFR